jgi:hypothetical protein
LQDIPGYGKFKKQGLQNIEELELCFGSITNIGVDHWSPHMANPSHNHLLPYCTMPCVWMLKLMFGFYLIIWYHCCSYRCLKVTLTVLVTGSILFEIIHKGAKLAEIYTDLYLVKNPRRTSIQIGMGWLEETMRTPGECHKMLRMNNEIFLDLHDVLVERYGLQPSKHMNTYEMLGIFLFICAGCESNRKRQNRFKHSGETISRKFHEVLDCVIAITIDYLRPTDCNFRTMHKRIWNDRKAYPHFKDCIGAIDGTHVRVSHSPEEQVRYIGKTCIATQNVLAICDFDMHFTYVAAGQPGSYHDTSVLYHAIEVDERLPSSTTRYKFCQFITLIRQV